MATCCEKLKEARDALHRLLTGAKVVSVSYSSASGGSRTVQFGNADAEKLRAYIRELEAACGHSSKRRRSFEVTW